MKANFPIVLSVLICKKEFRKLQLGCIWFANDQKALQTGIKMSVLSLSDDFLKSIASTKHLHADILANANFPIHESAGYDILFIIRFAGDTSSDANIGVGKPVRCGYKGWVGVRLSGTPLVRCQHRL